MSGARRIVIQVFHPLYHKSSVNRGLIEAVQDLEDVTVRWIYDLYPDFHIDLKVEQQVLLEHDIIIWQHPLYWYSSPSLLKEWIDIVLEHGFAFGRKGKALEGKKVMTVTTAGGSREVYQEGGPRHYTIPRLLVPFELTAELCLMEYLPPFVIHGTHLLDEEGIRQASRHYARVITALKEGYNITTHPGQEDYMNDLIS
jgi:glutathione-regulated potassium-efflux system ancillary protein KefG